ncbi:INO80 [Lepeophtheirus salmonis]|uniref:Chromatin-remodeling ATPase INO80 n=1 Tax=Lepeophtheirus salmonis TaxID=72036 RepID=A0A7R8CE97_LEPSM|nr:INO80 [Lepeophtheirus salmonis]CAF2794021.1 INO80 [Lepeophtheirus salmonis]
MNIIERKRGDGERIPTFIHGPLRDGDILWRFGWRREGAGQGSHIYSSDEDSEVLNMAEEECRQVSLTRKSQALIFDRMKKYSDLDSKWDVVITEESFQSLFASHLERKKGRAKLRNLPDNVPNGKDEDDTDSKVHSSSNISLTSMNKLSKLRPDPPPKKRRKKKKADGSDEGKKNIKIRAWVSIMKKEISKAQKARNLSQKEKLVNSKRVATNCMRFVRQRAMQSQRVMKETVWRAKRLSREMQAYWRRFDRAEKLQKRQQEKVAEEQRKMDVELLEAKRQQRKLNFLITQTELYAHFMASKIGTSSYSCEGSILSRLDEEDKTDEMRRLGDDYDCEYEKTSAKDNAINALEVHASRSRVYDQDLDPCSVGLRMSSSEEMKEEREQPSIFEGMLKAYQLKGMNWLLNLYDQGINGILADEMGLGKTVQALNNPCLDSPQLATRRAKSFETFLGSKESSYSVRVIFHIVITSYQLVISDFKYFNRIKWQYLVLDEAQAIKSSSSQRWKMLLEFKYIESTAENKSQIDEKQISRLHLILKPFMLRRIKKDVENELTDKLEVLLYCPLTIRQKLLYMGLKKKIHIEELLSGLGSQNHNSALTSSLMNLKRRLKKSTFSNTLMLEDMNHDSFLSDSGLVFVNPAKTFISHSDIILRSMPETLSHRLVRSRRNIKIEDINEDADEDYIKNLLPEFPGVYVAQKYTFMRLDGSSKIHERRDMVADFQERSADIFAFLLSTRAGGLGINLTAADTVIFYDSDWNPTVDQQAMDRAHRLGNDRGNGYYKEREKNQRSKEWSFKEMMKRRSVEKEEIPETPTKKIKTDDEAPCIDDDNCSSSSEPLPLFDFLGEKLGPKKNEKENGSIKRGPGRPRSKVQVGPSHQGSRGGSSKIKRPAALNPVDGII